MIGTSLIDLLGPSLFALNEVHVRAALGGRSVQFERFMSRPDGSVGHVLAHYIAHAAIDGSTIGFIIVVTDIKAFKMAEAELRLAASVYASVLEAIMVTDRDGLIVSVNPAFTDNTRYSAEEAIGQTPRLLRSAHHSDAFHRDVWMQISQTGTWQGEIWNRKKNGKLFLEWQTITKIPGARPADDRYIALFYDITVTWAVNDQPGHAVGDDLLVALAQKLQAVVRSDHTVARLGGDEFVVLLGNPANKVEIEAIARRIIDVINAPMVFHGQRAQVGTSLGIACFPTDGASAAALIKSADQAMYAAKRAGRNTFRFASPEPLAAHKAAVLTVVRNH